MKGHTRNAGSASGSASSDFILPRPSLAMVGSAKS